MNDGELIAWEVVDNDFHTSHICLRQELAEYLRDWCQAILLNRMIDQYGFSAVNMERVDFTIYECEVLV